jgi:hypothetical protein
MKFKKCCGYSWRGKRPIDYANPNPLSRDTMILQMRKCHRQCYQNSTSGPQKLETSRNQTITQKHHKKKKQMTKKYIEYSNFNKKIYIHVYPCESKPLDAYMQSFLIYTASKSAYNQNSTGCNPYLNQNA